MDQAKIGGFLKLLRKEKELTQEQLAERFYVSSRTVSRWETGSNMPDLSVLIEIADFYQVDIREILDGERKNAKMDKELKDTLNKVADYSREDKKRMARRMSVLFFLGILGNIFWAIVEFSDLPKTGFLGAAAGFGAGFGFAMLIIGFLMASGIMDKTLGRLKRRILGKRD
ncbi:MAG: helix-turn-helix transcriptional regulator [Clostridiales bacterium]|nr:helix-turn-helix transcriptional regulator [Clostridiales bacterium]